jgi:hypothetical protein
MSPPEIWGPAVWSLFHTLAEKINDNAFPFVFPSLFTMIVRICKFLPCPECSKDASSYLAKVKLSNIRNKTDFINTFYIFHNWVNAKKRKQLFNYSHIFIYSRYNLIQVVNNFISKYQTKGNMKLLTESFQRQFIIKDFSNWFQKSIKAFFPSVNIPPPVSNQNNIETETVTEEPVVEITVVTEEPIVEVTVVEEPVLEPETAVEECVLEKAVEECVLEKVVEEPVLEPEKVVEEHVTEELVTEETVTEETVTEELVTEEPVTEEHVTEELVTEETVTEEPVTEEPVTEEPIREEPVTEETVSSNIIE